VRALTLAALFSLGFASVATAARIALTPGTALIDAPVSIRVTGLPPERGIILRAATVDRYGNRWSSRLGYRADRSGVVDTHSNMRLSLVDAANTEASTR
jgi:Acyl-CoA thioester hydrolase/BAAT N-terminal region